MTDDAHADITSHDTYVNDVPHATFSRLRREDPVSWWDEADGKGFWALTKHADCLAAVRDYKTFTSTKGIRLEDMSEEETEARRTIMEMDPPEHTRLRNLLGRGFSPKVVATYEQRIREIATDLIETAAQHDSFDFVKSIARPLPMRMLGRLLGVPDDDGGMLVDLGDMMIANTDPDFTDHVVDQVDTEEFRLLPFRSPAARKVFKYADEQARQRREQPTDDIISVLLSPIPGREPLSDLEFKNFFALMVAAGNDTTRYTMTYAIKALIDRPGLIEELRQADAALWKTAVEEFLRWGSVTMHFRRTAARDVTMHGRDIKEGDKVAIWFISANRDEDEFASPFELDIRRTPNRHVTFGRSGPHTCLGMWLARLEIRVMLQEFIKRARSIEQTGPEARLRSNFITGIKKLPVSVNWA